MIANVLTFVDGSAGSMAWLKSAVAFCRSHGARLNISIMSERRPWEAADGAPDASLAEEFAPIGDDIADTTLPDSLGKTGLDVHVSRIWRPFAELPVRAAAQSRLTDVVLISPPSAWVDRTLRQRVIEAIVTDAGTPVLIVPDHWDPALIRTAVLAWNGSSQAGRAARALLPFVELGARIDVVVVKNGNSFDGEQSCLEITDQLAAHGFAVVADVCPPDQPNPAECLQAFAEDHAAQLLAVGGYSHSRLSESRFGGVTHDLIAGSKVPVLMVG